MTTEERKQAILVRLPADGKRPFIIALDGRAASGKTTLASSLAKRTGAEVVSADDFFLPPSLRTPERRAEPGGNIHYERFKEEVVGGLHGGKPFSYGVFDCSVMAVGSQKNVDPSGIVIVEGSYSLHPFFGDYADLTVFCDVSPGEQYQRILKRNGEEKARTFRDLWIPLEEKYFSAFGIREKADLIL